MSENQKSALFIKIGGFFWFASMAIGAFVYFLLSVISLFNAVSLLSSFIVFERGAYYLLGVSVVLMSLVAIGLYESYTKKIPSNKATKIFTRTAIGGLILTFALPITAEKITERYLLKNGYSYCDMPSVSWAIYKDLHYTFNEQNCLALNTENKRTHPSLYPKDSEPVNSLH